MFLHACDGDVQRAAKMMERHYEIRKKAPQLFTQRDATLPEIQQCLENQRFVRLPNTPDNHLVCYHALTNPIPKNYHYNPSTRCFLMLTCKYLVKNIRCSLFLIIYCLLQLQQYTKMDHRMV